MCITFFGYHIKLQKPEKSGEEKKVNDSTRDNNEEWRVETNTSDLDKLRFVVFFNRDERIAREAVK